MRINQDVKHIAQADLASVVLMSDPDKTLKGKGSIKVNSNVYNISIGEGGRVDVSFRDTGFWRFNWLRGKSLGRMQTAMQEQYDRIAANYQKGVMYKSGEDGLAPALLEAKKNTEKVFDEKFGPDAAGKEAVLYGFQYIRDKTGDKFYDANMKCAPLDHYNSTIGLTGKHTDAIGLPGLIKRIKSGSLEPKESEFIPKERLKEWGAFLQKNVAKIDIFGKIRRYAEIAKSPNAYKNATGWAGEFARKGFRLALRSLVKKNIGGEDAVSAKFFTDRNLDLLGRALLNLAVLDGTPDAPKVKSYQDLRDFVYEVMTDNGYSEEEANKNEETMADLLNGIVRSMFFRQTSKLGLDFCKEKGIPVVFQWSTFQGISLEKADNEINNKWWKNDKSSIGDQYGAPITYSEMRHVLKMEKAQENEPPDRRLDLTKVYGLKV